MLGKRSPPQPLGKFSGPESPRGPLEYKIQSPRGLKNYIHGGVGLGILAALEKSGEGGGEIIAKYSMNLENYTYVTSHTPNKSTTRVYFKGTEFGRSKYDPRCNNYNNDSNKINDFKKESPARWEEEEDEAQHEEEDFAAFPVAHFLSSCHLCRKNLQGRNIFMYRGEKGFCSTECRYRQIVIDERKEQCNSSTSRPADLSSSPYAKDQIFSTGIIAI